MVGIPVAPVTENLFPDKEAVLDGAVKILSGHKPIHHGSSPRGILPARRLYIRPQITVCGAQLHKAFPLSAHLRRFLHGDLPQAAIDNLGSPHHSGIQVKGVPQHLIASSGSGSLVKNASSRRRDTTFRSFSGFPEHFSWR